MSTNKFANSIYTNDGVPYAPSISFLNDHTTGISRNRDGHMVASVAGDSVIELRSNSLKICRGFHMPMNAADNHVLTSDSAGMGTWRQSPTQSGAVPWASVYKNLNTPNAIAISTPPTTEPPTVVHSVETPDPVADINFYIKDKSPTGFTLCSDLPALKKISDKEINYFAACRLSTGAIGVCYYDVSNDRTYYKYSLDPLGKAWSPEITIDDVSCVGPVDMAVVDGRPAVAYIYDNGDADEWRYVRAADAQGSTWGTPTILVTAASDLNFLDTSVFLRSAGGNPAVFYNAENGGAKMIRAADSTGATWTAPVNISNLTNHQILDVKTVDANPAVCAASTAGLIYYVRSTSANGAAWPAGATQLYKTDGQPMVVNPGRNNSVMDVIKGKLCIVASELTTNKLCINVSADMGASWQGFGEVANTSTQLSCPKYFSNNDNAYILYNVNTATPSTKGLLKISDGMVPSDSDPAFLSSFDYMGDHVPLKNVNDNNSIILFTSHEALSLLRFYDADFKINWIAHSFL